MPNAIASSSVDVMAFVKGMSVIYVKIYKDPPIAMLIKLGKFVNLRRIYAGTAETIEHK